MNKHKCDIDFEKHTPLMHLKLLVEKRRKKLQKNIGEMTFGGGIFNVVSLNYIGKHHLVS